MTLKELASYFWNFGLPIVMFSLWGYAGYKGWWVWGRELTSAQIDCREWKGIALQTLGQSQESAATAVTASRIAVQKIAGS